MFGKLLFTVAVVGLVLLFLRLRNDSTGNALRSLEPQPDESFSPRFVAYSFLAILIATSTLIFYFTWSDGQREVRVFVINSESGESRAYVAKKTDIEGRSFRTLDGRYIFLATTERMEVKEGP